MKSIPSKWLAVCALAAAASFGSSSAFAQGKFDAAASGDECNPGSSAYASVTCASIGSVGVTLEAWGFNGTLGNSLSGGFLKGALGDFNTSGFGAYTGSKESSSGGQHAFDNLTSGCGTTSAPTVSGTTYNSNVCGSNIEALFLDFDTAKVNLTNLSIGYKGSDADISVWAWTGAGDANIAGTTAKGSTTMSGTTSAALSGWTLVSNHNFSGTTNGVEQSTNGTLYSSYFLITTYFGATSSTLGLDAGNDSFKLDSFTVGLCTGANKQLQGGTSGTGSAGGNGATCNTVTPPPSGVPEPGSLALAGLALAGVVASRRKVKALF